MLKIPHRKESKLKCPAHPRRKYDSQDDYPDCYTCILICKAGRLLGYLEYAESAAVRAIQLENLKIQQRVKEETQKRTGTAK